MRRSSDCPGFLSGLPFNGDFKIATTPFSYDTLVPQPRLSTHALGIANRVWHRLRLVAAMTGCWVTPAARLCLLDNCSSVVLISYIPVTMSHPTIGTPNRYIHIGVTPTYNPTLLRTLPTAFLITPQPPRIFVRTETRFTCLNVASILSIAIASGPSICPSALTYS